MLKGLNILVADDDRLNQKILNFILLKNGANVKNAFNGEEAIDLISKNKFDIVLMDLQMPKMGGYAATEFIRKQLDDHIPIVALTADSFAKNTEEYIAAGMNACISKPVEQNELCTLILGLIKTD